MLMHLKHGYIRFGCTKQLVLVVLGLVSQLMGWVGSGHTKWTHGQLLSHTAGIYSYCSTHEINKSQHRTASPPQHQHLTTACCRPRVCCVPVLL